MKSWFFVLFVILFISCKSEEESADILKQNKNNVLPHQSGSEQPVIKKQKNIDHKIAGEILAVIQENLAATQAEDKERVLNTIHKDCPQLKSTKQGMDYVFANYDLVYNLEQADVIEVSGEEAKVYYVQTTKAKSGHGFTPNRSTGIHIMKKENGSWKIFKTEYISNEQIK